MLWRSLQRSLYTYKAMTAKLSELADSIGYLYFLR